MRLPFFFALLLALFAAPSTALAQTEALPDLTPREFEIQGNLQVDFSGIQRQPLSGFGPPPRAYVVPAERGPIEYAYGYPVEQIAPPALAAQPIPKVDLLNPFTGLVEGLAGVYAGRAARLHLQQNGRAGAFFVDVDYDGSSTYAPFDEAVSDANGIYNRARATLGYATYTGLQIEAGGHFVDHELYGAAFRQPGEPASAPLPNQPTRTALGGHATLTYESPSLPIQGHLRYEIASASTDLAAFTVPAGVATDDPSEGRLTAGLEASVGRLDLDGHASLAGTNTAFGTDVRGLAAGGAFQLRATRTSTLDVGGRVLVADGPAGDLVTGGPVVRFEVRPRRSTVHLFAYNEPRVIDQGLASVFAANPFAETAPFVMPEVQPINARGGIQAQVGAARATLYGGAQWADFTRFFERNAATGLFTVGYGETRRYFGGIEAALGDPDRVEATVGLEVRSGQLVDADSDVPYYAPVVAHATVTATLLDERLRLSLGARAEGTRPADRVGTEAPSFVDLHADAAFQLTERLDVLLRAGGLADEPERWAGYPEAPFALLGGLRARW
ncbi:MAG: hypothetical protein AAFP18_14235 [Bacteroidota bacterium]